MPRIALIGAGSVVFTRRLLGDIFSTPALRTSDVALHDIDPDRLDAAERMAHRVADAAGAEPRITASLDRRAVLRGSDFVINTIQVGGARATAIDFAVPARFGLRYTIADTIGVGGVFRALRTVPVLLHLLDDMGSVCPDAWLLNYTNPLATLVRSIAEASSIKAVGLCHSVYWTVDALSRYVGVPRDEVTSASAGVNHLAFLMRFEHEGRDLYPELSRVVSSGGIPDGDLVRAELFGRLGYYPTESSEHHAEYSPWFIGKSDEHGDAIERFHIPIDEYLRRVEKNLGEFAETRRKLDAGESFPIADRSGEYAAAILESFETGVPTRIVASVMNEGTLIPNLDAAACVEVPCVVDAGGIHPIANGPLPVQLAAYIRGAVDMQALTVRAAVHQDRAAVPWALMTDPIVQTTLTLDETWRLAEAMLDAEREWMPPWLQASA